MNDYTVNLLAYVELSGLTRYSFRKGKYRLGQEVFVVAINSDSLFVLSQASQVSNVTSANIVVDGESIAKPNPIAKDKNQKVVIAEQLSTTSQILNNEFSEPKRIDNQVLQSQGLTRQQQTVQARQSQLQSQEDKIQREIFELQQKELEINRKRFQLRQAASGSLINVNV